MDPNPVNAPLAADPGPVAADPAFEAAVRALRSDSGAALRAWLPVIPSFVVGLAGLVLIVKGVVSARQALLAAAVLLVHKLGWALAMRASGCRERGSLLMPFHITVVGASQPHPWKHAAATLAGPVPGVVLAAAVFFTPLRDVPVLRETAWIAVVANGLDLVPFGFLGGGRLLHAVVCRRHAVLEAGLAAMPSLAYVGLALATASWQHGAFAVAFAVPVLSTFRCARATARLSSRIRSGAVAELSRQELELLYSATFEVVRPRRRTQRPPHLEARLRASWMRQLHRRIIPQAPLLAAVALVSAWLLASGVAAATIAAGVRSGIAERPRVAHAGGPTTPAFRWPDPTRADVRIRWYAERTAGGERAKFDGSRWASLTATQRPDGGWSVAFEPSDRHASPGVLRPDLEDVLARYGAGTLSVSLAGDLEAIRLPPEVETSIDAALADEVGGGLDRIVARGRALEAIARAPMQDLWELLVGIVPREALEVGTEWIVTDGPTTLDGGKPSASIAYRLDGRVACGPGASGGCVLLSYRKLEDAGVARQLREALLREGGLRADIGEGSSSSLIQGFVVFEEATLFPRVGYRKRWTQSMLDGKVSETNDEVRIEVEPVR